MRQAHPFHLLGDDILHLIYEFLHARLLWCTALRHGAPPGPVRVEWRQQALYVWDFFLTNL